MKETTLTILENTPLTHDTYRLRLAGDTSAITAPGQFVNLKLAGFFLRRPISVCDWTEGELTLIYKVLGRGTAAMTAFAPGAALSVLTGLGNGYDTSCSGERPLLVGGGVGIPPLYGLARRLRAEGKASVLVAADGRCLGVIALSDVLRPEARAMAEKLSAMHVRTVLLTGDNRAAADYFARQAGISEVRAQLLPEQKVESIRAMQAEGRRVCMIGDGVNDAPALKSADVSVAMGSMGSDIAVEAADIALMSDDLSRIPYLKRLSNATVATIRLSITLSMCINFAAIALSLLGLLNPTTGALVHNAGSCFVVLIAALLYDRRFD